MNFFKANELKLLFYKFSKKKKTDNNIIKIKLCGIKSSSSNEVNQKAIKHIFCSITVIIEARIKSKNYTEYNKLGNTYYFLFYNQ